MAYPYGNYPVYMPGYNPQQMFGSQALLNTAQMPLQGQQTPSASQQPAFICCPVTSREEAVAYRVEAFGPAVIMPDLGHGMIYFKRFNDKTALADFGEFRYVTPETESPEKTAPAIDYSALASIFSGRLEKIEGKVDAIFDRLETEQTIKTDPKGAARK